MFTKISLARLAVIGCCALAGCTNTPDPDAKTNSDSGSTVAALKSLLTAGHLVTEIPEQWLKIRDSKVGNLHIAEYVPPDTTDAWVEKLSIEAMQGADLPDPLAYLDAIAGDKSKLCKGFSNSPIYAGYENGYESVVRLLECRENTRTGKPIVSMLKAIRGNQALYTISRFWRIATPLDDSGELAIDQRAIGAWSNVLKRTYACDPSKPAHPCQPAQANTE